MNLKVVFQVASTYIGAVMGAAFASGQEIQTFFANFGAAGLLGILISTFLFAFLGWVMITLQTRWRVNSYVEFFNHLFGVKLGRKIDILVTALLFLGMIGMLSGAGALFVQYFELSNWIGTCLTALVIGLALWYKGEGVLWINSVLIPIKFVFCIGIAFLAYFVICPVEHVELARNINPLVRHWAFSGVLYVSFNLTLAMVVFASLGSAIQKPEARVGAVCGGIFLGVFAMVIAIALLKHPEVASYEIPMVAVAGKVGQWPAFFYVVVLWLSMITAAIGNGFSLTTRIVKNSNIDYSKAVIGILLLVIPLSAVKFSSLVNIVYPIFGYVGLIFFPILVYSWLKS